MIPEAKPPPEPRRPDPGIYEKPERQKRQTRIDALTVERDAARADADRLAHLLRHHHESCISPPPGKTLAQWCTGCLYLARHEAEVAKR